MVTSQYPNRKNLQYWWHSIAALPETRNDHAYYALRRVWGDHTITGARSFYRVGSEDNVSSALFQNWALFSNMSWVTSLARATGSSVGTVKKVRWAYECEERLDAKLRPHHGRDFVIADIMLEYEDEHGPGLIAFEAKAPGKIADTKDDRKLHTYIDLPSTRQIGRRQGCLLVSERAALKSSHACNGNWPVLTWEKLRELQIAAAYNLSLPAANTDRVVAWIARNFDRCGTNPQAQGEAPTPCGRAYGTVESYRAIETLSLPKGLERFLKGSECVEAAWRNQTPDPPLPWLVKEPSVDTIRERKWQTTPDRFVRRWNFDWVVSLERTWC